MNRGTPLEAGLRRDGEHNSYTDASILSDSCLLSYNYVYCNRYDPRERANEERDNIAQRYRMVGKAPEATCTLRVRPA